MNRLLVIAGGEWRDWLRSHLAMGAAALFAAILVATSLITALRMQAEQTERAHHQGEAERTFLAQPDRHPHRMVHYGHYAFRTPAPLAAFDPGLDPVTGQAIFLEGHRQNSAMFADTAASADLGGLSHLTPALAYQVFGPLLIILLGHGAIIRERETGTLAQILAQGTGGHVLVAGKALALVSFVLLLLLALAASTAAALGAGESPLAALGLIGVYLVYLSIWAALTLLVSAVLAKRSAALATLIVLWLGLTLILPSIAVSNASRSAPLAGKIETDLTMLTDLRNLSDGHNSNDPAFDQLRADLLKQHGAGRVEDLPVNLRGAVAQYAEETLTAKLNAYAEERMASEARQADLMARHGWLTPFIAVSDASRILAGTDLAHYHRFLRDAERLRYGFVQALNRVHTEQIAYLDDINRSVDVAAERRTRVTAENWKLLDDFRFETASASARLGSAGEAFAMLLAWLGVVCALLVWAGGRLKP